MMRISIFFISILLFSCGKAAKENEYEQEEANLDGQYKAILIPVNGKISNRLHGEVIISKYGDEFKVYVHLANAPSGVHKQYLHTGSACPKKINDDNRDGYVDMYEARDTMGHVIVPFDDDLSSQMAGHTFPSGSYRYTKTTSYELMLSDLHQSDDVSNDHIIKLRERDLVLERRVVGIYSTNRSLSSSVAGTDVPIACGILTRVENEDTGEYESPRPRPPEDDDRPRRPRPRPRPQPQPDPEPQPEIDTEPDNRTWWDRLRQRWRRWRDRWSGGDGSDGNL